MLRLKFGARVAVDLHAHGNLNDPRPTPFRFHDFFLPMVWLLVLDRHSPERAQNVDLPRVFTASRAQINSKLIKTNKAFILNLNQIIILIHINIVRTQMKILRDWSHL